MIIEFDHMIIEFDHMITECDHLVTCKIFSCNLGICHERVLAMEHVIHMRIPRSNWSTKTKKRKVDSAIWSAQSVRTNEIARSVIIT